MARPIKWEITRERLEFLCEHNTLEDIATMEGVHRSTVSRKKRKFGLPTRKTSKLK